MKHPVDAHVGKRIRHRRWMVGMTQQQLAEKVGIKFQQIQKYETGMNRVSASRLWDVADALGVPNSIVRSADDVTALRKIRAEQQAQAQQAAQQQAIAQQATTSMIDAGAQRMAQA